jgi:hypothetical protein
MIKITTNVCIFNNCINFYLTNINLYSNYLKINIQLIINFKILTSNKH